MSHSARGPVGTTGIDGKAIAACRRQRGGAQFVAVTEGGMT
jgi:hypothetical protein